MQKSTSLIGLFFLISLGLFAAEQPWWNDQWEYRIPITIENKTETDYKMYPIVISGDKFYKTTGLSNIRSTSIRLVVDGKELPVQVDEKDATGKYLSDPDLKFDKDDEIIFQADIPAGKSVTYYIYASRKMAPAPDYPASDLKADKILNSHMGELKVRNSLIELNLKGGAAVFSDSRKLAGELGCGSILTLKYKGLECVRFSANLMQALPDGGRNLQYSKLETVISGPIRTIIVTNLGAKTRNYKFYNNSSVIEVEDLFRFEDKWDPAFNRIYYSNHFCPGVFSQAHELLLPIGGQIITSKMSEQDPNAMNPIFYNTAEPEAGYLAWFNPEANAGIACLFDKEMTSVKVTQNGLLKKAFKQPSHDPRNMLDIRLTNNITAGNSLNVKLVYFGFTERGEFKVLSEFISKQPLKFGFTEERPQ